MCIGSCSVNELDGQDLKVPRVVLEGVIPLPQAGEQNSRDIHNRKKTKGKEKKKLPKQNNFHSVMCSASIRSARFNTQSLIVDLKRNKLRESMSKPKQQSICKKITGQD